jgi:K+-transporting ATPase A subunit
MMSNKVTLRSYNYLLHFFHLFLGKNYDTKPWAKTKIEKKWKTQNFMGKTNFFGTLPFSLWAVLATRPHIGALQKI